MIRPNRYHLIVDIQPHGLPAIEGSFVDRLLRELSRLVNMKILSGPHVVPGVDENPGFTGFVIIDFSHISIHTFSNYGLVMVDIFSCKEFSQDSVIEYLADLFNVEPEATSCKVVAWG